MRFACEDNNESVSLSKTDGRSEGESSVKMSADSAGVSEGVERATNPTLLDNFVDSEHNAIYSALIECGMDDAIERKVEPHENSVYLWLEEAPKTSITVALVSMLHRLGFSIVRASPATDQHNSVDGEKAESLYLVAIKGDLDRSYWVGNRFQWIEAFEDGEIQFTRIGGME